MYTQVFHVVSGTVHSLEIDSQFKGYLSRDGHKQTHKRCRNMQWSKKSCEIIFSISPPPAILCNICSQDHTSMNSSSIFLSSAVSQIELHYVSLKIPLTHTCTSHTQVQLVSVIYSSHAYAHTHGTHTSRGYLLSCL